MGYIFTRVPLHSLPMLNPLVLLAHRNLLLVVLEIIPLFILTFLVAGCLSTPSSISSVYLVDYRFNNTLPLYPAVQNAYTALNSTSADTALMVVRVGYLGICVGSNSLSMECVSRSSTILLASFPGVQLHGPNASLLSLDLVLLATTFSNHLIHPYLLVAADILCAVLLVVAVWRALPLMPAKPLAARLLFVLTPVVCMMHGLAAMWQHVACNSATQLVPQATLHVVSVSRGTRAHAMTWTAFAFLATVALRCVASFVWSLRTEQQPAEPEPEKTKAFSIV